MEHAIMGNQHGAGGDRNGHPNQSPPTERAASNSKFFSRLLEATLGKHKIAQLLRLQLHLLSKPAQLTAGR
jgi:hypothetical protein